MGVQRGHTEYRKQVEAAYKRRVARSDHPRKERAKGIRRVDLLGDEFIFAGLEITNATLRIISSQIDVPMDSIELTLHSSTSYSTVPQILLFHILDRPNQSA